MKDQENNSGNSIDKPELESEASQLRTERVYPSRRNRLPESGTVAPAKGRRLRRFLYAMVPVACVAASVLLLSLPALRIGVVEKAAGIFVPDPDNQLYDLPAPRRKPRT